MDFSGMGVSRGIAVGRAMRREKRAVEVRKRSGADPGEEEERFHLARQTAEAELSAVARQTAERLGEEDAAIFEIHRMMLEDEDFTEAICALIREERVNAEYAVATVRDRLAETLATLDDGYMQARASDIRDVAERVLRALDGGGREESPVGEGVILCAEDLTPGETASLDPSHVLAFATADGSRNSHTAILARSMGIPAVVGLGASFLGAVTEGAELIVDGDTGRVTVAPSEEETAEAVEKREAERLRRQRLALLRDEETVTRDGRSVRLYVNVSGEGQGADLAALGAEGIGLLRSEFLYLGRESYPTEAELFSAYRRVLTEAGDRPVIVRTFDIGADKQAPYFGLSREENPALGMRGARLYFVRPELFRLQLRALHRASAHGRLSIMFPMITGVSELRELRRISREVAAELEREGERLGPHVEEGIMIETPAAALVSDRLAEHADFFSVGTNDLIQYTLACDRQNPALDGFCDPRHEAILRLIRFASDSIHRTGGWIGICGELAADTALTETFLRMGVDELSVSPASVLAVRDAVRRLDLSDRAEGGRDGDG